MLFRPFVGVAPRLYRRAFLKDRDLKDDATGDMKIGEPAWSTPWHIGRVSYVELEAKLARPPERDRGAAGDAPRFEPDLSPVDDA